MQAYGWDMSPPQMTPALPPEQPFIPGRRWSPTFDVILVEDTDVFPPELVRERVDELASFLPGETIEAGSAPVGRGASYGALLLTLIAVPSGIEGTIAFVERMVRYGRGLSRYLAQRRTKGQVFLSFAALKAIVLADVLRAFPDVTPVLVAAHEVTGGARSDMTHSGQDLFTFIVGEVANRRSWVYVLTGSAEMILRQVGGPLPPAAAHAAGLEAPPVAPRRIWD